VPQKFGCANACTCEKLQKEIKHRDPKLKSRIEHSNMQYNTSSTAQGGGGSFKNRKPIGEIGFCESGMAERIH
jgi:hypothetical protein